MSNEQVLPKVREFDGHDWHSTNIKRRNLPHWELKGSTYFITACVDSSMAKPFLEAKVAQVLVEAIQNEHEQMYLLYAYVVMPDHFHMLIKPVSENSLGKILHKVKGSSAYRINKLLGRNGKFWQAENYDHLIRNALSFREKWEYIKENPVKAHLISTAEEYPFSSFFAGIETKDAKRGILLNR